MIHFQISCKTPSSQFVQIRLDLQVSEAKTVILQLPAWRAGRYQLANYAQNIRGFRIQDETGDSVEFEKITKDRWMFESPKPGKYQIEYEYWAGKMDAGSAWADDEQIYVNLVNCCFEIFGKSEEEVKVTLDLPDFPKQISTLIPVSGSTWKANSFQMLADSTILAAKNLTHWEYSVDGAQFHIWINGEVYFDPALFLSRFRAFSKRLIQDFGEFPEPEYHFIFQLLPYPHYHGVEHRRGTVITFGPAESLRDFEQMEELLGISCHELYHAWNVCRIRPAELLPYDFSQETYTRAGLILEGVTTYLGDLYLLKSGVYDPDTYLKHFGKIITREAANFGWKNYTILESSFDLWLDGYAPGIPDRKVNIYTRGALLAICMDILLLKNGSSLAEVMRQLWVDFGKPFKGYELKDFEAVVWGEFPEQREIHAFFSSFIYGYQDLFPTLKTLLSDLGIGLEFTFGEDWMLHDLGIRTNSEGLISQIHPESKAYSHVMKNDRIINWPVEKKPETDFVNLQIDRNGRFLELTFEKENSGFFPEFTLSQKEINPLTEKWKA